MALSSVSYLGDGSNKIFSVTFLYLAKAHVKVYVAGVETTDYTWLTASSISITTAPASLAIVLIKRVTPTTPIVDFVDGSTLTESLLDTSSLQGLYVVEEGNDSLVNAMVLDTLDNKYEANSKVIKNVGTPVDASDATSKSYVDSTIPTSVATATTQAGIATTQAGIATVKASEAAASALAASLYDPSLKLDIAGGSLTGAIETKRATITATATTTPLWTTANGNLQDWTATPTITALPNAPQAGSWRIVYPAAGTIITHGGNISVQGNASYTVASGDELTITAVTTSTFYVTIKRKDGDTASTLVGYREGLGGSVTQATSKSTSVTLNKPSGQITTHNAALSSGVTAQFYVNNSLFSAGYSVLATVNSGSANAVSYRSVAFPSAGGFYIVLSNISGASLSDAVVINYILLKGSTL